MTLPVCEDILTVLVYACNCNNKFVGINVDSGRLDYVFSS